MEPSSIRNPGQPRCGAISPRLVIVMAAVVFLGTAGSLWATPPSWWSGYGVLNGNAANDYAVANQGQAKNIAVAAVQEMDNDLAQFGGSGLDGLAATLLSGSASSNDYAAVNLGQLKALTQPFYDRLLSLGYTGSPLTSGTYPWAASSQAPNDYAAANIGQVKNAFSFDVTLSSDGSGVPDWWEQKYSVSGTGTVIWSGGQVTDLQAYQQGLNPIDFYNGQSFTLAIVSGTNQTGSPGGYLPLPMTVVVTGSGGAGIPGAPVTFEVASGGGYVQAPGAVAASGSATVLADGNGQAQVYFLLSSASNNTSQITATTGTGSSAQQVEFTEYSDDGTGQFASLFAPSNCIGTVNSDGSYTLAWTNNTNGIELYIDIEQQQSDGSWQVISSELPAGTASYSVVSPTGSGQYRAETHIPDALNPSGDPTYAGPPFLFGISVLSYAAIDMSGTTTNGNPVNYATIDDFGNIAYGFFTGQLGTYGPSLSPMSYSTQFASYTWSNGIAHPSTILPMTGSNATQTYSVTLNSNMESTSDNLEIDATGDIWGGTGVIDTTITGTTTSTSNGFVSGTSAGTGTVFGNTIPIPNPPYGPSTFPGVPGQPSSSILELTSTANYAGYAAGFLPDYQTAYSDYFIFHAGIYHIFNFNDSLTQADLQSGAQLEPDDFIPAASADHLTPHLLNDNGWALGYSYDFLSEAVWNGTTVIPLPDYPAALNNQGYVIGNQGTPSDGSATSYVWTSLSGSATPMTQLIPQPYEKQLTNIQSLDISGSDANGTVHVLFRANYQTVTTGSTALGLFMLNLLSGTTPTLAQISLPSNVPNYAEGPQFILNPQMLMTTIGDITTVNSSGIATTGTQRALLLLPVQINEVTSLNPAPGQPVTSASAACVGEPVTLSISGTNIIPGYNFITGYKWHLPNAIKNYNPFAVSNPIQSLAASDSNASTLTVYYPTVPQIETSSSVATSGTESVSCDLTLVTGGTCTITSPLRIVAPAVQVTGSMPGPLDLSNTVTGTSTIGTFVDGENGVDGMDANSSGVTPPVGFTSGSGAWLQVLNQTINVVNSGTYQNIINYQQYNDHGFPVPFGNMAFIKPGNLPDSTSDSPYQSAQYPPQTELDRTFSAGMFYMWLSNVQKSIWVPLGVVGWGFKGQINWSGSLQGFEWQGTPVKSSVVIVQPPPAEPKWPNTDTRTR